MGLGLVIELGLLGASLAACFHYSGRLFKGPAHSYGRDSSPVARHVFAATFSLTCGLFGLLLFEIAGLMERGARLLLWRLYLGLTFAVLLLIIPVLQIRLALSGRPSSGQWHHGACFAAWLAYVAAFWFFGGIASSITTESRTLHVCTVS